jgi:hypothetical protein
MIGLSRITIDMGQQDTKQDWRNARRALIAIVAIGAIGYPLRAVPFFVPAEKQHDPLYMIGAVVVVLSPLILAALGLLLRRLLH